MTLSTYLTTLKQNPKTIVFADTMAVIEDKYTFTPTAFQNGTLHNAAGQNSGSCKLFAFAKAQQLSLDQTLACFGAYYFEDVLNHPNGTDHQNIRNFMLTGWDGLHFEADALALK
ncbi:HopJ type III effector protein [Flavobacterium crassostreae]|uniref:Type III effector n=1 Tax=Flavobacterium crassostreae TaxID=1763534 RepID=A0A1B9E5X6_9FLAO|nr:HopJ type III effector protein [Flavobacterium crassostreae]OCB77362.1 type III effector [Flavobacterium crassostreae]